jgi:ribose/xylose/arabinose/galactoside ABC-type transport system permease subunit
LKARELSLFFLILFFVILLSILTPNFWQISNFKSIARGFFLEAIPLIGMTFLLVSGVFDLSVGSVMALSGYVTAALVVKDGLLCNKTIIVSLY